MKGMETFQSMSVEQIKSMMDVMQEAADAYLFIMDLTADILIIPEELTRLVPLDSTWTENCLEEMKKVIYPEDYHIVTEAVDKYLSGEQSTHDLEYRLLDRENTVFWINCRGITVTGKDRHQLIIGRISDLGRKAKADNVTGLRKEAGFRLNAEEILRERPDSIRYCMRIGIDNFKEINEKDGMKVGDEVLYELSKCITDTVEEGVDVYRLVADEFMIIDTCSDPAADPVEIYKQIKSKVKQRVKQKDYSRFYTISAGILDKDFADKSSDELMKLSEFALNEAKRNGRNQMAVFDKERYYEYLKRLDICKMLRRDISNNFRGFQVYYQPIVDVNNSYKVIGAEALLRWNSEKYGNVSPIVMIPIMEESGLIIPVGRFVLWEAARMCKKWQGIVPNFHINVNLSYIQVHKSDLMNDVSRCIEEIGLSSESLVLELTESGYIETDSRIQELFQNLKENKINLAIDDFGTGYSNMRYLKDIEAKTVKLDRSFVLQALQNEHDYIIISHIVDMVHSVGATVCMEGIEYEHELEKMKQVHPDMIQGFLFGKPSSGEEFEKNFLTSSL